MSQSYHQKFEKIVQELFEIMGHSAELTSEKSFSLFSPDLIAKGKDDKKYVDIKFYRSKTIPAKTLKEMAQKVAFYVQQNMDGAGYLVVNTVAAEKLKSDIYDDFGVVLWDREVIYSLMTQHAIELRDEFEQLLLAAQQGNEIYDVFSNLVVREPVNEYHKTQPPTVDKPPVGKGKELIEKLRSVPCGRDFWKKYENVCQEIFEYLFQDDLVLWERQNRTDDGLSRFDLICRIASNDDYWKALISSFNTRFVLFEFKNYCEEITQDQVYATERYLYTKGLRSVGYMITANGMTKNAEHAAKGALKESGKLIQFLTNQDLEKMLEMKDQNGSCNDYLSDELDKWLISLSR